MISIVLLAKDNQETIKKTLDSLKSFAEVLVIDTGSKDKTLEIALQYPNVKIHHAHLSSFGHLRNEAAELAAYDWVFHVDSDEELSDDLICEIQNAKMDETRVYAFPRLNFFNGKAIRFSSWYPEHVVRLYHRKKCRFCTSHVHESLLSSNTTVHYFHSPLYHTPYRSFDDFLKKMQLYSSLFAEQYQHKKSSSLTKALLHAFFAFFKNYILKKGFLGGEEGLIISLYNGHTAFYKYLKLWERNQKKTL